MPSRLTGVVAGVGNTSSDILVVVGEAVPRIAEKVSEECLCDPGGFVVSCSNLSLTTLPLIRRTYLNY
jgi:hypothetical protein